MKKYILTHGDSETDIAFPWEFIPEEAIELIDRNYICKVLFFSPEDGMDKVSAVFLQEVDSFKRGTKKFKIGDDVIVGV